MGLGDTGAGVDVPSPDRHLCAHFLPGEGAKVSLTLYWEDMAVAIHRGQREGTGRGHLPWLWLPDQAL